MRDVTRRNIFKKIATCLIVMLFISLFNVGCTKAEDPKTDFEAYYSDEVADGIEKAVEESDSQVFVLLEEKHDVYNSMIKEVGFDRLGGAYFDDQGKLHILQKQTENTREMDTVELTFNRIVGEIKVKSTEKIDLDEWVGLELCKYSYNELMEYQKLIDPYYSYDGIFASGIDDSVNKISVYAIEGTDVSILDDLIPEDAMQVIFRGEEGETAVYEDLETYTAYCGSGLINDSKGGAKASLACSVGWDLSTSQPKYGYLTAGHFASTEMDMIGLITNDQDDYVALGRVVKTVNNRKMDAALIDRGYSSSSPVASTSTTISGTSYKFCGGVPEVGNPVTAYGYASNGAVSGVVVNSNYNTIKLENMVLTSMKCEPGDSGGPVIAPITTSELSLSGIVKGSIKSGDEKETIYVKFNTIMDEWDLNGLQ